MDIPIVRRKEIVQALRGGRVPARGLENFADGMERFEAAIDEELELASVGNGIVKAVRGEYGAGKTFFSRWVQQRARERGFAASEVSVSGTEAPLHRMDIIYRRMVENLTTREIPTGAFQHAVDHLFHIVEEEALAPNEFRADDRRMLARAVRPLLERRLARVSEVEPQFAACLRTIHEARMEGDHATEQGLIAWLMGKGTVGAEIKRRAQIAGRLDHLAAGGFLRGMLELLRQTGRKGLVLVLDEVERVQRARRQQRSDAYTALLQLTDDVSTGKYPGLYLLITGTTELFEGPRGLKELPPLAQRFHRDFGADPRFDASRAVQVRLLPFDDRRLLEVGRRVRDLYPARNPARIAQKVSDPIVASLGRAVTSGLRGHVGVAPRLFLMKLIDLLDKVDEHESFDPTNGYPMGPELLSSAQMTADERAAAGLERSVDDIELEFDGG